MLQFARRRARRRRAAPAGRRRRDARRRCPRRHRPDRRLHLPAAAHLLAGRPLPALQRGRRGHRRGQRHRRRRPQAALRRPSGRGHRLRRHHRLGHQQRRFGQAQLQRPRPRRTTRRAPHRPAPKRPYRRRPRLRGGTRHRHPPRRPGGDGRTAPGVRPDRRLTRGAVLREEPDRTPGRRRGRRRHGPRRARRAPRDRPAHGGLRPAQPGDRRRPLPHPGHGRTLAAGPPARGRRQQLRHRRDQRPSAGGATGCGASHPPHGRVGAVPGAFRQLRSSRTRGWPPYRRIPEGAPRDLSAGPAPSPGGTARARAPGRCGLPGRHLRRRVARHARGRGDAGAERARGGRGRVRASRGLGGGVHPRLARGPRVRALGLSAARLRDGGVRLPAPARRDPGRRARTGCRATAVAR